MNIRLKLFNRLIALEADLHGELLERWEYWTALSLTLQERTYEFHMDYKQCSVEVVSIKNEVGHFKKASNDQLDLELARYLP